MSAVIDHGNGPYADVDDLNPSTSQRRIGRMTFTCTGCDAEETVPVVASVTIGSVTPTTVRARLKVPSIADLALEGWVVNEPYTFCTYCPDCWAEIQGDIQ